MANKGQQNAQVFDTDDPDRIQDIGWTAREVWRRSRGFVVTSINIITCLLYTSPSPRD